MYRRHVDELSEEVRKRDRDGQQGAERDRVGQEIRKMGEELERLKAEMERLRA